jgi:Fic family protein
MIYQMPECGAEERAAIQRIEALWRELRFYVAHDQKRWVGSVRRLLAAVANQGSNSIEGYNISTEDAIAAIQGAVEPMDSRWQDWQANLGYRRAMTYVLQLAQDQSFEYSTALLRSLHFMMVEYDLDASPGLWRPGPIWVQNERTKAIVYEGPDNAYVPTLAEDLVDNLNKVDGQAIVRAAMAHLNLVLIHPFRDGNGRMARCLQSLVLVRDGHLAREFCSIEEFLGVPANQQRYYDELHKVARGHWTPENDARSWIRFCLEAHYIQAISVLRRVRESEWIWEQLDQLVERLGLHPRMSDALFDASLGLRIRNSAYRASLESWGQEISAQTATTDLRAMVKAGLLEQVGAKRGAHYVASDELMAIRNRARQNRQPLSAEGLFDPVTEGDELATSGPLPQTELFPPDEPQ